MGNSNEPSTEVIPIEITLCDLKLGRALSTNGPTQNQAASDRFRIERREGRMKAARLDEATWANLEGLGYGS